MKDRKGVYLDGRGGGTGRVEGRENIIRIYYVEKILFSIKVKK